MCSVGVAPFGRCQVWNHETTHLFWPTDTICGPWPCCCRRCGCCWRLCLFTLMTITTVFIYKHTTSTLLVVCCNQSQVHSSDLVMEASLGVWTLISFSPTSIASGFAQRCKQLWILRSTSQRCRRVDSLAGNGFWIAKKKPSRYVCFY